ncbi:MAG: arylsulfatase [Pirellulaceae bacterium]|nr:arylsulfatase [Pirellulaceae bacterium]
MAYPVSWVEATRRPNVVVILTDDQGWGDLSLNGNRNLKTPRIDALARAGTQFDRFFVCPVCSPTRAEFLTGRYHPRSGVFSTSAGGERINLDEMTIAQTFQAAGYATGAFGKWHNGMQYPYHPNGRGFQEYYGFCSGHWGNYFDPMLERNGRIVRGQGFIIDDLTTEAMAFMEHNREKPFFVYIPYNTPHSPMQVPSQWWNKFKDKELLMHHRNPSSEKISHIRAALAMRENIDWNVGRIVAKLEELDLTEETIIVYFCDNGPNGSRWNGDMKGRKGSTDEGGVRSPLLIHWPGKIAAGKTIPQISAAIDLLPTLADLAEIPVASKKPLDGISLKPLLAGQAKKWPDRMIYSHWRDRVSLRTQRFRMDHEGHLYDMRTDPGQRQDVAAEHPTVTAELQRAKLAWSKSLLPELKQPPRPFLIGHRTFKFTQMPARDGAASGNIQRSNRFPNCSYFRNWTQLEDTIRWNVEVAESGTYDIELYYACPAKDIGSTVELSLKMNNPRVSRDPTVRGKVVVAHDPPVIGASQDRTPRQESYEKDFKALKLGQMTLAEGTGKLVLRALEKPESQVMEVRLIMFTRVSD